jgi:predicted nucleic acid-binding protein
VPETANRRALTQSKYEKAIEDFQDYMSGILTPPGGDAALIKRATKIQRDYGCSHATDCLYIALAEELTAKGVVELLTFDKGLVNQAASNAPTVRVNLLLI